MVISFIHFVNSLVALSSGVSPQNQRVDATDRWDVTSGALPAAVLGMAATCSMLIAGTRTRSCANDRVN